MLSGEAGLKAAAAVAIAAFGFVVLVAGRRRVANQFLGAFLLLVAANQGIEAARVAMPGGPLNATLYRFATVVAALDPLFLFYFASLFPERNRLNRPVWVTAAAAPAFALALAAGFAPVAWAARVWFTDPVPVALSVYTTVIYAIVLVHVVRRVLGPEPISGSRALVAAMSCAAIPRLAFLPIEIARDLTLRFLGFSYAHPSFRPFALPLLALGFASAVGVVALAMRKRGGAPARGLLAAVAPGFVLALLLNSAPVTIIATFWAGVDGPESPWDERIGIGGVSAAAIRWLAFAALITGPVMRHDMLLMGIRGRRAAARVLVAVGVVALAAFVALVAGPSVELASGLRPFDFLVLGLVVAASQGFRRLVDSVAERVLGVPMPGDRGAALDAYRAALEQALREGRSVDDPALAALRGGLGIDEASARVLARMASATEEGALGVGRTVAGRYRVLRLLGKGGHGRAFLARDDLLARDVVLKEVAADEADAKAKVLAEARTAGALQHPNVVTVHDVIERDSGPLLVQEFLPGGSLGDRLARDGPLSAADGDRVAEELLSALAAVHARGIVHRDVKPSNVLLTEDGSAKLGDFGIARHRRGVTVGFADSGTIGGTPEFMAPEQWRGALATPATDVYALGVLLDRAIAGPHAPPIAEVLRRARAEDPAARWPDGAAMREAWRAARALTQA